MLPILQFIPVLSILIIRATAFETWCGKHYEPLAPRTPPRPESYFHYPPFSDQPLLDFSCVTASSIYIRGDEVLDPPFLIFDANLTQDIGKPYLGGNGAELEIRVYHESTLLLSTTLIVSTIGHEVSLPLEAFEPSFDPRTLKCIAVHHEQTFEHETELVYLPPNPFGGSSVKLDRRTGGLKMLKGHGWEDVFPFGFYDSINVKEESSTGQGSVSSWWSKEQLPLHLDSWAQLTTITNRDRLTRAKNLGFNLMHPVPPSTTYTHEGDDSAIHAYFDIAEELDIGVMYDMRHGYTNLDLVRSQVEDFRSKPSLVIWYTADEPDGPALALDSTSKARNLIRQLDPYHPIALVLNCHDYHFRSYASGTDILLVDVYSIAINPIWSKKWNTEITNTFGCSGCDGCKGNFYDLPNRLEEWQKRTRVMGRSRTMPMWVVPQAFDDNGDEFWWRIPDGIEVAIQILLGVNHGVLGHCAWLAMSASEDILNNASFVARHMYDQKDFIITSAHTRRTLKTTHPEDPNGRNGLDLACWTKVRADGGKETLVLAVQMYYTPREQTINFSPVGVGGRIKEVLFGDVRPALEGGVEFRMGRTSIAGVVLEHRREEEVGELEKLIGAGVRVGLGSEL